MSRKLILIAVVVFGAAVLTLPLLAQGPQTHAGSGPHGIMSHAGRGPGLGVAASQLDLAGKTVLEGVVDGISMGRGQGTPSFTMVADGKKVSIVTSPYRALLDANYKISIGDRMNVVAFPFVDLVDIYAAAELKNLTTGVVLTLRDANGVPLLSNGDCANCPYHSATQPHK